MSAFAWGKVIEKFTFDFDGVALNVTKYYPQVYENGFYKRGEYKDTPQYHCDEMHSSFNSMLELVVSWITYKQLGPNHHTLASGICRALDLEHPTGK